MLLISLALFVIDLQTIAIHKQHFCVHLPGLPVAKTWLEQQFYELVAFIMTL